MSAREALAGAVLAAVRSVPGLGAFDAPPVRGALPFAVVGEPELRRLDAAGLTGRQARFTVEIADAGERPARLRRLIEAAEQAVLAMPADLGGGWQVGPVVLARSRIARAGDSRWRGMSEFVGLVYRFDS